jgi:hypothetical protein
MIHQLVNCLSAWQNRAIKRCIAGCILTACPSDPRYIVVGWHALNELLIGWEVGLNAAVADKRRRHRCTASACPGRFARTRRILQLTKLSFKSSYIAVVSLHRNNSPGVGDNGQILACFAKSSASAAYWLLPRTLLQLHLYRTHFDLSPPTRLTSAPQSLVACVPGHGVRNQSWDNNMQRNSLFRDPLPRGVYKRLDRILSSSCLPSLPLANPASSLATL